MHDYKELAIYFNSDKRVIGVPCGESEIYGISSLDIFFALEPNYSDDELEAFINKVFDACFSKKSSINLSAQPMPQTAIQKYTGAKSYVAAVKGYSYVDITWIKDDGYTFTPTEIDKKYKGAFIFIEDKAIKVPTTHEKGALAKAFRQAMEITIEHG